MYIFLQRTYQCLVKVSLILIFSFSLFPSESYSSTSEEPVPSRQWKSSSPLWSDSLDLYEFVGRNVMGVGTPDANLSPPPSTKKLTFSPRKSPGRSLFTDLDNLYDMFSFLPDYAKRWFSTKAQTENATLHAYFLPLEKVDAILLKRRLVALTSLSKNSHLETRQIEQTNIYLSYPFYQRESGLREFHYLMQFLSLSQRYVDTNFPQVKGLEPIDLHPLPESQLCLVMDFPDQPAKDFDFEGFFRTYNRDILKDKGSLQVLEHDRLRQNFRDSQGIISQAGRNFRDMLKNWDEKIDHLSYDGPSFFPEGTHDISGTRVVFSLPLPFSKEDNIPFELPENIEILLTQKK